MPLGEFELIQKYFSRVSNAPLNIKLGIGDDAALVTVPPDQYLVVAIDTLVSGVHFPVQTSPVDIAYKALAVNLSDMAAMGATPAWFTLALTLPDANERWLGDFATGLFELAQRFHLPLIGGDTTRGPLSVTIQIAGHVPGNMALLRSGACAGDIIYTTGTLGDAAAALRAIQRGDAEISPELLVRLNRPSPRVSVGIALRGIASACIDISDGLLADLGHILEQSGVGASLNIDRVPITTNLQGQEKDPSQRCRFVLNGGDDYELCFTVPPNKLAEVGKIQSSTGVALTPIGRITATTGLRCVDQAGQLVELQDFGFQHFR